MEFMFEAKCINHKDNKTGGDNGHIGIDYSKVDKTMFVRISDEYDNNEPQVASVFLTKADALRLATQVFEFTGLHIIGLEGTERDVLEYIAAVGGVATTS